MAFWGAPLDDPDHARHAVQAALVMRQRLPMIHAELAAHGWPALQLNIGINTGTMVVGDMGSRHRRAYTVMGDAVNLAARLQAFSSRHGLGLVVGEATRAALGSRRCLALGRVSVRGRHGDLQAWLPLPWHAGEHPGADRFTADWQAMRLAVEAGHFAEADRLLASMAAEQGEAFEGALPLCRWQRSQWALPPAQPGNAPTG
jgi:adenylate cyclase